MNRLIEITSGLKPDKNGIWTDGVERKVSYPTHGNQTCNEVEDSSYWFGHRNDCIVAIIRRYSPPGPILDVGGGNGFVTRRLLDEGFDAAILEPGPEGARIARTRRGITNVIRTELGAAGFADDTIPAIGCFDVIEHIEDDRSFITLVSRLLQPGGLLYATTPAHRWLWSASDVDAGHFRRYTRRSIEGLLSEKLELVHFTHLFGVLVVPILVLRTVPWLLGLNRRRQPLTKEVEHGMGGGPGVRIVQRLLDREREALARGRSLRTGSSCLFVARKRA